MRRGVYLIASVLGGSIFVISIVAATAVGVLGTYLGIKMLIDGKIERGVITLFLTTPALMLVQTVIGLLAAPLLELASRLEEPR